MSESKLLWAPWRMEYVQAPKSESDGCIFCDKPKQDNDRENLVLFRGNKCSLLMNLYPYNNGHLMIAPYKHCSSTDDLCKETYVEIMSLADKSMRILEKTMHPQGFNFGANIGEAAGAGIAEHIHFHIVPRWNGDTNLMPVVGHTKVMVQGLRETFDLLKPEFDQLG